MTEPAQAPPAPPPPAVAWRPPSIFGTFRGALRLVRLNARTMLAPMAAVVIPVVVIGQAASMTLYFTVFKDKPLLTPREVVNFEGGGSLLAQLLISAVIALFFLVGMAATYVAAESVVSNRPKSLVESLDPAFTRMGSLLLLGVLAYLAIGVSVWLLPLLYVVIRLSLAPVGVAIEGLKPGPALGACWRLMRGHTLRLFALMLTAFLVLGLSFLIASLIVATPLTLVIPAGGRDAELIAQTLFSVVSFILVIPMLVVIATSQTLFYLALRAHQSKEGLTRAL